MLVQYVKKTYATAVGRGERQRYGSSCSVPASWLLHEGLFTHFQKKDVLEVESIEKSTKSS